MSATPRLGQLDALRGVAALAVVLFHFTTRYDQLFHHTSAPLFSLAQGYRGVNLFFMISGFVIVMTLARTPRAADFVVSRFSRLYPAYWGALLLTFAITHAVGLPGKVFGWDVLAVNLTMIQGFFRVPHLDEVYWTLEIELIFYFWALVSYRLGTVAGLRRLLFLCLGLRLTYAMAAALFGIDLPWSVERWLILPHIAWFALGVAIYLMTRPGASDRANAVLGAMAILVIGAGEGWGLAGLAMVFFVLLYGAARGQWTWLEHRAAIWLGSISYTLYLVHENFGWTLIRRLEGAGVDANVAIALAIAASMGLAQVLTWAVEQPAMRWIRDRYKARRQRSTPAPTPVQG